MKWFKHFTNAHDNNDLTKLRMRYGADGYAIYWYCLELIAGDLGVDESITFELKHDAEVIGFNLKIDTLRVEEIMKHMINLGLFESASDTITCLKLAKYLDKKITRNIQIHQIIDSVSATNKYLSATDEDKSGRSPLDIDIDIDISIYLSNPEIIKLIEQAGVNPKFLNRPKDRLIYADWIENKVTALDLKSAILRAIENKPDQLSVAYLNPIVKQKIFERNNPGESYEANSGNSRKSNRTGADILAEGCEDAFG